MRSVLLFVDLTRYMSQSAPPSPQKHALTNHPTQPTKHQLYALYLHNSQD